MSAERYARLMAHFDALCDLPLAERVTRLAQIAQQAPDLADELRRLLEADATDGVLDTLSGDAARTQMAADVAAAPSMAGARFDHYLLVEQVGVGGTGEVYRALDERSGQTVALKILRAHQHTPKQARRFRREFRAVSGLDHPAVVRVFAEGVALTRRYLVMEWMGGGDLTRMIQAPLGTLLPILLEVAGALDHVHRRGIVHRDLKPANVLLTEDDPPRPKLTDFGIVKVQGSATFSTTSGVVGTLAYLAPEQALGEQVDTRADLYALGCMVFVLLTGQTPFNARTAAKFAMRQIQAPALDSVYPQAPAGLVDLVAALMQREPADRPQSAEAVWAWLAALS